MVPLFLLPSLNSSEPWRNEFWAWVRVPCSLPSKQSVLLLDHNKQNWISYVQYVQRYSILDGWMILSPRTWSVFALSSHLPHKVPWESGFLVPSQSFNGKTGCRRSVWAAGGFCDGFANRISPTLKTHYSNMSPLYCWLRVFRGLSGWKSQSSTRRRSSKAIWWCCWWHWWLSSFWEGTFHVLVLFGKKNRTTLCDGWDRFLGESVLWRWIFEANLAFIWKAFFLRK